MVSGATSAEANVHVTGRRVLATLVDGVLLGFVFAVMSMLFGSNFTQGEQVTASLEGFSALVYFVAGLAYYMLMERPKPDAPLPSHREPGPRNAAGVLWQVSAAPPRSRGRTASRARGR